MSYAWWFVVILLTSVVLLMGFAYLLGRGDRPEPDRPDDDAILTGPHPYDLGQRGGRWQPYGCKHCDQPAGSEIHNPERWDTGVRLPSAGLLDAAYGPFPVDTRPLLLWSESEAAKADLGRWTRGAISETDWLVEAGEREIPPRWR